MCSSRNNKSVLFAFGMIDLAQGTPIQLKAGLKAEQPVLIHRSRLVWAKPSQINRFARPILKANLTSGREVDSPAGIL